MPRHISSLPSAFSSRSLCNLGRICRGLLGGDVLPARIDGLAHALGGVHWTPTGTFSSLVLRQDSFVVEPLLLPLRRGGARASGGQVARRDRIDACALGTDPTGTGM